jgi:hypothetical protein
MESSKPVEVTVRIDQQQPNQYVIQTSQLERIGALVRGKTTVVKSIAVSFIVSFVTACVIPYFTWIASMNLQRASDRAEKGVSIYEQAAMAIDSRWNVTNDFFATITHMVNDPPNGIGANSGLYKAALDLQSSRWISYNDALKTWNKDYDGILAEIDYGLDRPVLAQIDPNDAENKITSEKTSKITCAKSLSLADQLQNAGYVRYSLKAQFAAIGFCLGKIDEKLGRPPSVVSTTLDRPEQDAIKELLNTTSTMSNSFLHCYADWRLQYFYREKQNATLTVTKVLTGGGGDLKYDTKDNDDTCEPDYHN